MKDEIFGDVIFSYTRKQALEDGVLIDVSSLAKEAGIKYPVAVTAEVWAGYVEVPEKIKYQDETGRLWDIVWMLSCAIRSPAISLYCSTDGQEIRFGVYVLNDENKGSKLVKFKALCHPGDNMEPVITIMMPWED
jgi:hypothetical protein